MKRQILRITLALVGIGVFFALGSAMDAAAQEKWKLRLQNFSAKGHDAQWVSPGKLVDFIREETGGRVEITMYPATQLVPTREIYSAVGRRVVDAGTVTGDYISGQHPESNWSVVPVTSSRDEWYKVMEGGAREYIDSQLRKDNVVTIGYYPLSDMGVFALTDKPLKTLADFKGRRIRGFGGVNDTFMARQGAGVTVMSMGDAYTAVQTGVLDGVATALSGYHTMKGWEIAPYLTWTKGMGVAFNQIVILNAEVWDSFPPDIQAGIRKAEKRHKEFDTNFMKQWKVEALERFKKAGVTVTVLSPEAAEDFRLAFLEVGLPAYLESSGEPGRHVLGIVEKVLGKKILE